MEKQSSKTHDSTEPECLLMKWRLFEKSEAALEENRGERLNIALEIDITPFY